MRFLSCIILLTILFISCDQLAFTPEETFTPKTSSENTTPTIILTSPNGGEDWEPGSIHTITWSAANLSSSYITIKLYKNGSYNSLLSNYTSKNSSYSWSIPSNLSISDYYKVRIQEYNSSFVYDDSDSYFSISLESPTITLTSPNGGEDWEPGSIHTITWSAANLSSSYVTIKLYKNGIYSSSLTSYTNKNVSYTWSIPSNMSTSDYYKIRIEEYNNSLVYDESNSYFSLSSDPCSGVSCSSYCSGNYAYSNGSCSNGDCSYSSEYCFNGCSNGSCESDPCSGVSCSSYCSGNYAYSNGSCSNGDCSYSSEYCSNGCSNGSCESNPCAGVSCTSFCSNGIYYYNGSCTNSGNCNYDTYFCPSGCNWQTTECN